MSIMIDQLECHPCGFTQSAGKGHFHYGSLACPHCWTPLVWREKGHRLNNKLISFDLWQIIGCEDCKGNTDGEMDDQVCSLCGIEYGEGMIEFKNK